MSFPVLNRPVGPTPYFQIRRQFLDDETLPVCSRVMMLDKVNKGIGE